MAAKGGESPDISHDATSSVPGTASNLQQLPKRKPVAERKSPHVQLEDDLITYPDTPKPQCGNTYSLFRCGHKQADCNGITHAKDCPGVPLGEWFCTNINPSGIMVPRKDQDCPRCLQAQNNKQHPQHRMEQQNNYGQPVFSYPYAAHLNQYGYYAPGAYPSQAGHFIPSVYGQYTPLASPSYPNPSHINVKAETHTNEMHVFQPFMLMNPYPQGIDPQQANGEFGAPLQPPGVEYGNLPSMPLVYHEAPSSNPAPAATFGFPVLNYSMSTSMHHDPLDFNSFKSNHPRRPLGGHLMSPEQAFAPNPYVASTVTEAENIKVKLPQSTATRHNPVSVPIQIHSTPKPSKENEEDWSRSKKDFNPHSSDQPGTMLAKNVHSTTESQERRQAQHESYLKDNQLPTSLARLHESHEFMETRDTRICLKPGSRLDYALQNAGFKWPGSYSGGGDLPTVRHDSTEKIHLVQADSPQAAEIQRPFPPRKSSLPVHVQQVGTRTTSPKPTPDTIYSSENTRPSVKETLDHISPSANSDELKNSVEGVFAKSGASTYPKSATYTGGVDKKFLSRPWRQLAGPPPSGKGFSFGPSKSHPSQTPAPRSKVIGGSPVEAAIAKKSAVPTPNTPREVGTTEKSAPFTLTREAAVLHGILSELVRDSRPMHTDYEQKNKKERVEGLAAAYSTPKATPESRIEDPPQPAQVSPSYKESQSAGYSTFLTQEEHVITMEHQRAQVNQQQQQQLTTQKYVPLAATREGAVSCRVPIKMVQNPRPVTADYELEEESKLVEVAHELSKITSSTPTFELPRVAVPTVVPTVLAGGPPPVAADYERLEEKKLDAEVAAISEEVSEDDWELLSTDDLEI